MSVSLRLACVCVLCVPCVSYVSWTFPGREDHWTHAPFGDGKRDSPDWGWKLSSRQALLGVRARLWLPPLLPLQHESLLTFSGAFFLCFSYSPCGRR